MSEPSSNVLSSQQQRWLERTESLIESAWPGGLAGAIADYTGERATLSMIEDSCKVTYRGLRKLLETRGVPLLDKHRASIIARRLNPQWGENISRTKLLKPYRHPPDVQLAATAKRVALTRIDPSRHGQAHMPMTSREQAFSDILTAQGVAHRFNQTASPYWLDFYLPDMAIGIEVQKPSRLPDKERADHIRKTLGLTALLYVPNYYFFNGNIGYMESLVWTLKRDHHSISRISDANWLCIKQSDVDVRWYGFGFKRRWSTHAAERPISNP